MACVHVSSFVEIIQNVHESKWVRGHARILPLPPHTHTLWTYKHTKT